MAELTHQLLLLFFSVGKRVNPKGTLANHDIWLDGRDLGFDQMSLLFARIVARVQDLKSSNFNHKHRSTEDVSGVVWRKAQTARNDDILVVVDSDCGLPGSLHICFIV